MQQNDYQYTSVTTDAIIVDENFTKILLITRKNEPFKGKLAFPGGFLDKDETLKDCCVREVFEETNLSVTKQDLNFEMFLDNPHRDSRGRVLSAVFSLVLSEEFIKQSEIKAKDDAISIDWFSFEEVEKIGLAFDHNLALSAFLDNRK